MSHSPLITTRATVVRAGQRTTLVALPAWCNGDVLVPVETWIIMMATGQTRGSLPGTELDVRARLTARTEAGLALQDWEPINPLEPSVLAAPSAGTATPSTVWN
ncbi:hypothetical protein [Streptomyces sp. NBC_00154]|uniref:hypothetical protein n=1 Tax=Streptomyces sp. NBC_00154 TaxID=2975670 RepID=UPI00224D3807|nr:hypothetical protein [Streptomyces sp. NBC_00154]MCX5318114.1 hypothetical protein [Streptomyces sp. NBC_00154]